MYDLQLAVKYAEPEAVLLGMAADCVYYQWISRKSAGGAEEPASHIPPTHTHYYSQLQVAVKLLQKMSPTLPREPLKIL